MQKITFQDDNGKIEIALTPKKDRGLFLHISKRYQSSGGYLNIDAMLTEDEAIWMRSQLQEWLDNRNVLT